MSGVIFDRAFSGIGTFRATTVRFLSPRTARLEPAGPATRPAILPTMLLPIMLLLGVGQAFADETHYQWSVSGGNVTITNYVGPGGAVVIPSMLGENPVNIIGARAFRNNTNITSATIPGNVARIDSDAFRDCTALASVTIGNGVNQIESGAFAGCRSLESVTIPDSVVSIGNTTFLACSALTSVTIGHGAVQIGNAAFAGCPALESITVAEANPAYGSLNGVLFNKAKTILIQYPASRAEASYAIPSSVSNIWDSAFFGCAALASVTIPDSVKRIGQSTFAESTALASVTIPDSVASIGDAAFRACTALESIVVAESNATYSSLDGVLFNKAQTTLIQYPAGNSEVAYTVPDSVTIIGDRSFHNCATLANLTIPDTVTRIGDFAFWTSTALESVVIGSGVTYIGGQAFGRCSELQCITVAEANTTYSSLDGALFNKAQTALIRYPAGKAVATYTTPDGVTFIGSSAFENCGVLESVVVGNGVAEIGSLVFGSCASLSSVLFIGAPPANVGSFTFENSLPTVYYRYAFKDSWGATFEGRPTAIWPEAGHIVSTEAGMALSIHASAGHVVTIQARDGLLAGEWETIATPMVTEGDILEFTAPGQEEYPKRFFRILL